MSLTGKYTLYCRTLDKTISNLEMELAAARAAQESILNGSPISGNLKVHSSSGKRRYLMVVGINTAFSSRKRRDSVRATWMPQGSYTYLLMFLFCFTLFYRLFGYDIVAYWSLSKTENRGQKKETGGRERHHHSFCYWSQVGILLYKLIRGIMWLIR